MDLLQLDIKKHNIWSLKGHLKVLRETKSEIPSGGTLIHARHHSRRVAITTRPNSCLIPIVMNM